VRLIRLLIGSSGSSLAISNEAVPLVTGRHGLALPVGSGPTSCYAEPIVAPKSHHLCSAAEYRPNLVKPTAGREHAASPLTAARVIPALWASHLQPLIPEME
jgi:hypothetical protein